MHDSALERLREKYFHHQREGRHGEVTQTRSAGRLFAGDYSTSTTVGREFGGSRLGLGVMHDLGGEVVSRNGITWRVPVDGKPIEVGQDEGIAFGVAAHGGTEHKVPMSTGLDMDGILAAIDAYLEICPYKVAPDGPLFVGQRGGALSPRIIQLAMERLRGVAMRLERVGQRIHFHAGAAEHDRGGRILKLQDATEGKGLLLA